MKKLMIAACAIAMAAVAQAGAVNWSAQNLMAADGKSPVGQTYTAYLFIGSATDLATAQSYLVGDTKDFEKFEKMAATSRTASYDSTTEMLSFGATAYNGPDGNGYVNTTVSAFAIIIDSDDIDTAKNYLVATKSSGDQIITQEFKASGNKSYSWGNQAEIGWTAMSVPEPTSGLLLLLGVAGLALRRRRA